MNWPEILHGRIHQMNTMKNLEIIKKCFEQLILCKIDLKGVILKPNMILPKSKEKDLE